MKRKFSEFIHRLSRSISISQGRASEVEVLTPRPPSPEAMLSDYLHRSLNLFNRSEELQQRYEYPHGSDFERYVDTEAIIFFRELQEVGIPFPPWKEMVTVNGETDLRTFLSIGHACFEAIKGNIPDDIEPPIKVLDFGIGCARTMRFFFRYIDKYQCYGCDVDKAAISYVQEKIPFIDAYPTGNLPPLPFSDGFFDLVYSISVFSHFKDESFDSWLNEIHRILKNHGVFQFSIHGEHAFSLVSDQPQRRSLIMLDEQDFQKDKASFYESGYLWMEQPLGSTDIDARQFGISFFSKEKVLKAIDLNFHLIAYERGGIGNWQDLVIVSKKRVRL